MMMSYDSLVSGLQAKSVLANIHASLVQHEGWLTKENYERYNFLLENEKNTELLARKGMKDMLFAVQKDQDAEDYMLLSYGLSFIEDKVFRNLLQENLSNLVFEDMIAIDWSGITPNCLLSYIKKNDKSIDGFPNLNHKLDTYKSNNSYAPFSNSILKGQTKQFVTNWHDYFIQSILSYLEYGKNNFVFGNKGQEWNNVENEKFDAIYLDCYYRQDTLLDDLNKALMHLTDKGVILIRTNDYGTVDFRKFVIDNTLLEAFFSDILYNNYFIIRKKTILPCVYIEIPHISEKIDTYTGTLSGNYAFEYIKSVNYDFYELRYIDYTTNKDDKFSKLYNILTPYKFVEHNDSIGPLFCYKNFAKDFDSFYLHPQSLDIDNVNKFRKVTSSVLVISKDKENSQMAYVEATEQTPIYVSNAYLVYSVNVEILPEYLYYLTLKGIWQQSVTGNCLEFSANVPCIDYENGNLITETDEQFLLNWCHNYLSIPSIKVQKEQIEDARLLQKIMDDKNRAKEVLFNQKEWLNEAHIRNTKHRLSNDISPLAHSIQKLHNYMEKSAGHIHRDDVLSKKTGWTVGSLIDNMLASIKTIENTVSDFTNIRKYTDTSKICISEFLCNYCKNLPQKYSVPFSVETKGLDVCAKIEISQTALTDMLDNIVGNAVRHGFVKEGYNEYVISFDMEITNSGMCRLSISNNGKPMFERAKDIYFERGSFVGPTGHTGIGGAIVKDVCDQFNGRVSISENEKYPVVIVVEFPVLNF